MLDQDLHQSHLEKIDALLRLCEVDTLHPEHVKNLSLSLFDQINPILNCSQDARRWLEYAALLHDVGWIRGRARHHKISLQIILDTPSLDFTNKERLIIGSIARYHRKTPPTLLHDHFKVLDPMEREMVRKCSALLRLANALDASHQSLVTRVSVNPKKHHLRIECFVHSEPERENAQFEENHSVIEEFIKCKIKIKWNRINQPPNPPAQ